MQAEPVAQPLDRRAGDEDGAFERVLRRLVLEPRRRGAQDAFARRLLGLDEHERARAVRRLRAAGGEERGLLVAGDALDRQRVPEQLALAEVRAGRLDLGQQLARDAEELEQLVVPVERRRASRAACATRSSRRSRARGRR